jgi:hypothetical protein
MKYFHSQCSSILDRIAANDAIDINLIESKRCICDLVRVLCENNLDSMFQNTKTLTEIVKL